MSAADSHVGEDKDKDKGKQVEDEKTLVKDQDFYFNFYASLQNQANMIGDISRTGTYRKAILGNAEVAFRAKTVLDVGAGSGILSYMAAQAGASEVIALEASSMADKITTMINAASSSGVNPHIKDRVRLVKGMVENKKVQADVLRSGKVDTIVSEPIGVMILHERMVESFLLARDLFLKPGGQVFPSAGSIYFAPFSDEGLFNETDQKAAFFHAELFGTDFTPLHAAAREEVFAQPVIGMFPPASLLSGPCAPRTFDFYTASIDELLDFEIPVDFVVGRTGLIHGLASWFDLDFTPRPPPNVPPTTAEEAAAWDYPLNPPQPTWSWMGAGMPNQQVNPLNPGPTPPPPVGGVDVRLSTGPSAARTHWQQARLLLPEPLAANKGERVIGTLHFKVNDARSYDITLDLCIDRPGPDWDPNPLRRHAEFNLAQQCFNYSYSGETAVPSGMNGY